MACWLQGTDVRGLPAGCLMRFYGRKMRVRCFAVRRMDERSIPPEELSMRFGDCPVFLTIDKGASPCYIFCVDARFDTEWVCEEEGYTYSELFEEDIDRRQYSREHRVERPGPDRERRASVLATRKRNSSMYSRKDSDKTDGYIGGGFLGMPIVSGNII